VPAPYDGGVTSPALSKEVLARALEGDTATIKLLLDRLAPIIQARAARVLMRRGEDRKGREIRQEVEDMTQEVFLSLFDEGGRALRAWRPELGLSLENFVGLVADRQVASILRSGRRSPWKDEPTDDDALAPHVGSHEPLEHDLASRDLLVALLDRLREELSPRMLRLFYALWVEEKPVPDVCEELGMQPQAVYTARNRIAARARQIAVDLQPMSDRSPSPQTPREEPT